MIAILSPAKTLDFESPLRTDRRTTPRFLPQAESLITELRTLEPDDLAKLMKLKRPLAELNVERIRTWNTEDHKTAGEARQALYAFRGEVYRGLDADTMSSEDLEFAQEKLRVLSGLYGVLRPLDLILPYRLEMGTSLATDRGDTLYQFWGDAIARELNSAGEVLVNLASQEYFRAAGTRALSIPVITPIFREQTARGPRVIAVYAKRQRGRMARYIVDNRIDDPVALKSYDLDGYHYDPDGSSGSEWVFLR